MKWRIECQTCKHAKQCFDGYGEIFSCDKDECLYEPYETTASSGLFSLSKTNCPTCKHAMRAFDGYKHFCGYACYLPRCQYEPATIYETVHNKSTSIDYEHKDTKTEANPNGCDEHSYIPKTKQEYLSIIHGICIDYDGYRTVDGLMSLIDEIKELAEKGMEAENDLQDNT